MHGGQDAGYIWSKLGAAVAAGMPLIVMDMTSDDHLVTLQPGWATDVGDMVAAAWGCQPSGGTAL